MRAPADTQALDFNLQKLALPASIGARVHSGAVRLVVIPCRPQPVIDPEVLRQAGIDPSDSLALIEAVKLALEVGLIGAYTAPIRRGHAFELLQELPGQNCKRLGTALVQRISITRIEQLTDAQLRDGGHASADDFAEYWANTAPDIPTTTNPWCWLIQFEYKG